MIKRNLPIGAEVVENGVHFRVWTPHSKKVEVILEENLSYPLHSEKNGYFSGWIENLKHGALYQFRLDGQKNLYPDPASRYQPKGPKGPSQVIDFSSFKWKDKNWKGIPDKEKVILYEFHVGTFTPKGTWKSAQEKLPHLVELGINTLEMMPIAEWDGKFNWGYDGVNLFAPTHNYGTPDDLRSFIDRAHAVGIAVILDVVYNHFGPEGNFLPCFSKYYLKKENTEWGSAINFDGPNSKEVRAFFLSNVAYWIKEFHFDGLRVDACHSIKDKTKSHILSEITIVARTIASPRQVFLSAENEKQEIQLVLPIDSKGHDFDAVWNEDFHHTAFARLTRRKEAYISDYHGRSQEFISAIKYGFLYQGQWYRWQKQRRGTPSLDTPASSFIIFLENHDQVANTGFSLGLSILTSPASYRTMTTLFLLSPQIPLLFQGQEFGSTAPFYYFCDYNNDLGEKVMKGRKKFLSQFPSLSSEKTKRLFPSPIDKKTFLQSKLNWQEKEKSLLFLLHKDLIQLRKKDAVLSRLDQCKIDGAVINDDAFLVRYRYQNDERLLIFNFGSDLYFDPAPEPLIAPPKNCVWKLMWSSEEFMYGGIGYQSIPPEGNWSLSGECALILFPKQPHV